MKKLLFSLVLLFNINLMFSQEWKSLNQNMQDAFQKREWKSYVDWAAKAKTQAEKEFGKLDSAYAISTGSLGLGYGIMGEYEKAEKLLFESLEIQRKLFSNEHPNTKETLGVLATLYYHSGQFLKSEKYFKESIDFEKINSTESMSEMTIDVYTWLGNLYIRMGRIEEAKLIFEKVYESGKKIYKKDDFRYALLLTNLAGVNKELNKYKESIAGFKQAIAILELKPSQNLNSYANILESLGSLYLLQANYKEAIPLYKKSLSVFKNIFSTEHPYYVESLLKLTKAYHAIDDKTAPIDSLYKNIIKLNTKLLNAKNPDIAISKAALANFYYFKEKKDASLKLQNENLDYFEKYLRENFNYLAESERESFYTTVNEYFEQYCELAIREYKTRPELLTTVYNLQLRYKSILLNTTNQIKNRIVESGDPKLIKLYDEVQELKKLVGQPTDNILRLRNLSRDSLKIVLKEKDEQLNQLSAFYAKENELPTWKSVQKKLKKKEAAVEIIRFRSYDYQKQIFTDSVKYAALIITPKTKNYPDIVLFDNGNYLEKEAISYYRKSIQYEIEDEYSYNIFWKPLSDKLKKSNQVFISMDGIFHSINLMTLQNPKNKKFLLNEKDIVLLTSGKDFLSQKRESLQAKSGLLIGNPDFGGKAKKDDKKRTFKVINFERGSNLSPLPGTEKEVKTIKEMLDNKGWKTRVLLNKEAQEVTLKNMQKPNILHIATHGFFQKNAAGQIKYSNNPLYRSGLLLSGAEKTLAAKEDVRSNIFNQKEDGLLTAFEAMYLNIDNTDLVVLSACETGLGEVVNGEGVYGLQRALKVAGARSIIMSLWKVDDEATRDLMISFYENWLSGKTKRTAFKAAQNTLIKKYNHPYYWGGFVLIGE